MSRFIFLSFIILFIIAGKTFAFRRHGFYISDGFGSSEQFRNVSAQYTNDYTRMGMPLKLSGPVFITYRYSIDGRFSAGITAGFDNSTGRITRRRNYFGIPPPLPDGTLGIYHRESRTVAAELQVVYYSSDEGTMYGSLGGGFTSSNITITYPDEVYREVSKTNPGLFDPNPLRIDDSRFAHQVTFFGYRTAGALAFYTELGFGYKGLVHLGLSYEFGKQ